MMKTIVRHLAGVLLLLGLAPLQVAASEIVLEVNEPFGLSWGPDRVTFPVQLPGAISRHGYVVEDESGQRTAAQLSNVKPLTGGGANYSADVSFMVRLSPHQRKRWRLVEVTSPDTAASSGVRAELKGDVIELTNGRTGIRLVGGHKRYPSGASHEMIPAPLQAVRLPGGQWIGKGWWETDIPCLGYEAHIRENGPVFATVEIRYEFAGGRFYSATIELNAEQDSAIVTEEYNLSLGQRYPMSGVDGMRDDERYAYVLPRVDSPEQSLLWDWWGQTMARLPTPNAYCFAITEGFSPNSATFHGQSRYGHLTEGDGGLTFDKDGRFAYLNSFLQWGDEETLYLGLWNSERPADQIAFVGLRPSQWVHPDIDPHPSRMIKQYVQTNCPTFERRRSGEAFMRAPVCLGKRVYGIGGVERRMERQVLPRREGPSLTDEPQWGSDLMLRYIRLGSVQLNEVRRWVLEYEEPALYPRMYVPEGDRARYESRRTREPLSQVREQLAAQTEPSPQDRKVVADALSELRRMVQHFAQVAYGHMDYGINLGLMANRAEDALSSPACTAEQAREIRRYLAALVYHALNPDFVPPRASGFAWGSANMMAQVRCRTCYLVALLPNHPHAGRWRHDLSRVVTLYVESQINPSGATLECPHYGTMAIAMPAHALAALAGSGELDLSRAEQRLRAAAVARLNMLLPWDLRGNLRSTCVEGDGYYSGDQAFAPLIGFFQTRDPSLAQQLMWGLTESGNKLGGHADASFKMVDPGLQAVAPQLTSTHIEGYGFLMRRGFPGREESYLKVYAGAFSWGHGHNDRGTWVYYADGVPLMVDFAAMYTPSMRQNWMHPGGLTFNHDETVRPVDDDPADQWWKQSSNAQYRSLTVKPFTVVEMKPDPGAEDDLGTLGRVTAFQSTAAADYARMERRVNYLHRVAFAIQDVHGVDLFDDASAHEEVVLEEPFLWTRQFVLVKPEATQEPCYFVVRDDFRGNSELDPNLNLWALADEVEVDGPVAVFRGQHGVDLHCYIAEPTSFSPSTRTLGHTAGFEFAQHYQATFGQSFREEQLQLRIPQRARNRGYFVAVVPVRQGQLAPRFSTLAAGRAIEVDFGDRKDVIVLQPEARDTDVAGLRVKSEAIVILQRDGERTVTDLAQSN